jgi:hypothetical protein
VFPLEALDDLAEHATERVNRRIQIERVGGLAGRIDVKVNEIEVLADRLRIVLERGLARPDQRYHVATKFLAYFNKHNCLFVSFVD